MTDAAAPSRAAMARMDGLAARVAGLAGWRRCAAALALGALATLALPPLDLFPAVVVAVTLLVWLTAGGGWRQAFAAGWWFGFGYFVIGLYWIGNALLTFAEQHAWMLPFANLGLPAFLALFTAASAATAAIAGTGHLSRAIALALSLAVADWLRGHVLTGFPWNLFGHAWAGSDVLVQSAALYGTYGQSIMVLLIAALPAGLAEGGGRRRLAALTTALVLLALHWGGGMLRLAETEAGTVDGIGIRLVQSSVPQREKWDVGLRARNLRLLYELSLEDRPGWVTAVVWPETAATFFLEEDAPARAVLARLVPPGGALVTGAPRRQREPYRVYNSIVALDDRGEVVGRYDKAHLVPFGEYVPLAGILPLDMITHGSTGYTPGPGPETLRLPGLPPAAPAVCYEVVFPGAVVAGADRPALILNLTNDAWYGATAGPHQHLAIARVRAVEEGLPLVRSAYTGISAVVDAYGRTVASIPLNNRGYLDSRLPGPLPAPPYARFGDLIFLAMLMIMTASLVFCRRLASGPGPAGSA